MAKKRTTITIEKDLFEFARKMGLNISAFLEERLRELKGIVQGARFELANPYGTGPSSLRLWPGSATPAYLINLHYLLIFAAYFIIFLIASLSFLSIPK